jgi:peroxygenase
MLKHATRVSQQLHGRTPISSAPKRIVTMRFKNGRSIEQISTMPEAPLTEQLKPPTDLEKVIPNPGMPRAYNIPDRYHPEEDGAEPRTRQTVLQQHVEFFDYDKDGIIWPTDTYKGFRDIGYNPFISFLAPFFIHGGMSIPTQPRPWLPNLGFPIHIKNIHRVVHGSDSGTYDEQGRYVPQHFEEIFSKYDTDNKEGLTYKELMRMVKEQQNVWDFFGSTASFLEWTITYVGFKDENGVLPREAIRKQYNGSLFYEYASKMGKNMKQKKGQEKLKA